MARGAGILLVASGAALAVLGGSAALTTQQLGLDPNQRPLAIAFIALAQLLMMVIGSDFLASWLLGRGVLLGIRQTKLGVLGEASGWRRLLIAARLLVGGLFVLSLAVPLQSMLVVWLLLRPSLLLPEERVILSVELGLTTLWLAYLSFRILRGPGRGTP